VTAGGDILARVSTSPEQVTARKARVRVAIERLFGAHFVSYPIGIAWAVACMPIAIHLEHEELERLNADSRAIGDHVLHDIAPFAIGAIVLTHLAAIPWALALDPAAKRRLFWRVAGALFAVAALLGASSWGWLLLR
jgi:hypothetical protein